MSIPNPYKVLQVDPEAEEEVIEAAYRRLARKYHPDVATGPDAQERMVRINQAWEVLQDPVRRAAVDRAQARAAATAARVTAAEAVVQARAAESGDAGSRPHTGGGFRDRTDSRDRTDRVSQDWSSGRSTSGGGYDPRTMGTAQGDGSAGPPPGKASGSVLSFGRYAGWSLGEVARADVEYLEWLDRMPIGRSYQPEIDALLRAQGRRAAAPPRDAGRRGLFRRR